MKSMLMSLGHAAMHSPWLVHAPKRPGPPRLDPQLGAVRKRAHMQLTRRGGALRPVRAAVDHHAARPANPLATVVVECDRIVFARQELLVQDVQQLEKRHVGT